MRRDLLSVKIRTRDQLLTEIDAACERRAQPAVFVGVYPALSLVFRKSPAYQAALSDARTYPDGTGTVLSSRMLGAIVPERLSTTDVVHDVLELAEARSWRVLLYGARPSSLDGAVARLTALYPTLAFVAAVDGYQEFDEDSVRKHKPDLVLVATGAPRQEIWAAQVALPAGAAAILTCGGLFDFLSNTRRRAPRWVQRVGFEWMFRVIQEPRRLLWRYLAGNALFLVWLARAVLQRDRD